MLRAHFVAIRTYSKFSEAVRWRLSEVRPLEGSTRDARPSEERSNTRLQPHSSLKVELLRASKRESSLTLSERSSRRVEATEAAEAASATVRLATIKP